MNEQRSALIKIAAELAKGSCLPSDLVDDYPQKTYSASRVAAMMELPRHQLRDIAVELKGIYDKLQPEPVPETLVTLTDSQMISAVATLGLTLLMLAERQFPPHKLIYRKVKAVEEAILDLYAGTGQHVDVEITEKMCACWDRVMQEMSADSV